MAQCHITELVYVDLLDSLKYLMKHGCSSESHGGLAAGIPHIVPLSIICTPNSCPVIPANNPISVLPPYPTIGEGNIVHCKFDF